MTFKPDQFNKIKNSEEPTQGQGLEQEKSLENIGNKLIEIGKKIKEHPSIEKLKGIAKELGKSVIELFSKVKQEEKEGDDIETISSFKKETFQKKLERSINTIISYGMYALVLTGSNACTEEVHNEQPKQPEKITHTIKIDESKIIEGVGEEEQGYTYYDKSVFDDFDTFYEYVKNDQSFYLHTGNLFSKKEDYKPIYNQIKKTIEAIEKEKEERIKKIESNTYLERLIKEVNGNKELAQKIQRERKERILNGKYFLSNHPDSSDDDTYGYVKKTHDRPIFFGYNIAQGESPETIIHELRHQELGLDGDIPKKTREYVNKNFIKENFEDNVEYFSNPNEVLARKAVFDEMLERLNIKKYNESFTKEHYQKIKKLIDDGNIEGDAEEFFRMFEKDALIMIMNTVAYQDAMEKGVPIEQGKIAEELVAKIMKVNELNKQGDTYYPPEFFVNNNTDIS